MRLLPNVRAELRFVLGSNGIGEQWEYFEFCNMKHWPIWSSVMGRTIGYVGYKVEVKIREKAFEKAWRKNLTTIPSYTEEETEEN